VVEVQVQVAVAEKGSGARRWWALGVVVLSVLVLGLDATILVTAIPTLSAKLGASTDQLQWIVDAYTLALGGLLIPAGALADRYGRRRLLMAGLAIFGVSSLVASQASTADMLIWARAAMGVGGAIIMPIAFSIIPTLFTPEERPRAISTMAAATFVGVPLGPLAAGWLLTNFAWGSVFLINVPVVALALLGAVLLIPESRDADAGTIDWLGALLVVAGATALVYGIIEEPIAGWGDAGVLLALAGGAGLIAVFALHELRTSRPLVDLTWFRDPLFAWSTFNFAVVGAGMFGVLFVLTPYLQLVQGNDPRATGIRLLPLIGGLMLGALPNDRLTARLGRRPMIAVGLVLTAAGALFLSTVGVSTQFAVIGLAMALIGFGLGSAMPPALDAILSALPAAQMSAGTALTRAIQNVAASFGVALLGSVLDAAYRSRLDARLGPFPPALRSIADGSLGAASAVAAHLPESAGAQLLQSARDAYVAGMSEVLVASGCVLLVGAAATLLFFPGKLSR
jgi:MFS transporter, DHA2 family, multidrug resistance protein